MTDKQLLKKLKNAYQCCSDCGNTYGIYRAGISSVWEDNCDVCGELKPVTECRDYGYLQRGINELKSKT